MISNLFYRHRILSPHYYFLRMSFVYAIVLRDKTPLAEFPLNKPELASSASSILSQVNLESPRLTAQQGNYLYTTLSDSDNITFIGISDKSTEAQLRNSFINEIQREWRLKYGSSCSSFAAHEKDAEFGPIIEKVLNNYNNERAKQLQVVHNNISEAQMEMSKNMEMALNRRNRINEISEKADDVSQQSQLYYQGTTDLRRKMCWQKYKMFVLIGSLITILIIFLIIVWAVKNNKDKANNNDNN